MSASKKSPSRGGGGDVEEEDEPLNQSRQSASMRIEDVYDITSAMDGEEGNLTQHPFHTNLGDGSPRPSRSSHASSNNRQSHHSHHSNSANHNKTIEDSTHDPSDIKITWVEHDSQTSCFYQLCEKQSKRFLCCKWTGFRFYNQNHYLIYCSTIWMMIALLTAVILPLIIYAFIDTMIDSQVVIDSTSSPSYEMWQTNVYGNGKKNAKITMNMYFFDISNVDEVMFHAARPELTEIGPYSYDEYYNKFDIQWFDDGDTVQYLTQKFYLFNEANSAPGLKDTDRIIMPYPTVVGFKYILDAIPPEVTDYYQQKVEKNLTETETKLENDLSLFYNLIDAIDPDNVILPRPVRDHLMTEIYITNQSVNQFFDYVNTFMNDSSFSYVMFKQLMCNTSNGVSPFWRNTPAPSWFGWLQDPILLQVSNLIAEIKASGSYNESINGTLPWTSAVPGPTVNWTSEAEVRRRKSPDTYKTGKKNRKQVGLFVKYQNMTEVYTCIHPARNQNQGEGFVEGEAFPSCAHFQSDWTQKQAVERGWVHPFNGTFANRVEGSDCTLFGRPLTSPKVQLFLSDIFRSAFAVHQTDESWYYGIPLKRYGIQDKDVLNATMNPENNQYYSFGPQGLLNLTVADNLPVFVTFPHFYMADTRLLAAVQGLHPVKSRHETVVDIEPQTGALVRAKKRLQVNYQLDSVAFPEMSAESRQFMSDICTNITDILTTLIRIGIVDPADLPVDYYDCNTILFTPFFECLAVPSNWKFLDDRIFFPYSWVDEYVELPESEAKSWNDSLFLADKIAVGIRLWGLVIAGIFFAILVVLLITEQLRERQKKQWLVEKLQAIQANGGDIEQDPMLKPLLYSNQY